MRVGVDKTIRPSDFRCCAALSRNAPGSSRCSMSSPATMVSKDRFNPTSARSQRWPRSREIGSRRPSSRRCRCRPPGRTDVPGGRGASGRKPGPSVFVSDRRHRRPEGHPRNRRPARRVPSRAQDRGNPIEHAQQDRAPVATSASRMGGERHTSEIPASATATAKAGGQSGVRARCGIVKVASASECAPISSRREICPGNTARGWCG